MCTKCGGITGTRRNKRRDGGIKGEKKILGTKSGKKGGREGRDEQREHKKALKCIKTFSRKI